MKNINKIFILFAVVMLMFSFVLATASATTEANIEKKDTGLTIESKEKKLSTIKVTWNANGGKIGTKKTIITNVKKGSKIAKLASSPKKSGYTFNGWFTQKTVGKK